MVQLTHSADYRAPRLESSIPGIIKAAMVDVVTPLRATIDAMAVRTAVYENGQGTTKEVKALQASIPELMKDVDQLKSTDMSMDLGTLDIHDVPKMPPSTNIDDVRV